MAMGNCLFHQQNQITIMKTEAYQVLSDFAGFSLSETLPTSQYIQPKPSCFVVMSTSCTSSFYTSKSAEKKVRFLIPGEEAEHGSSVVRIKLVMTMQKLQKMLKNEAFPADEMISQLQTEEHTGGADTSFRDDFDDKGWRPALESIPEGN